MNDRRVGTGLPSVWTAAFAGIVTLFAAVAVSFATRQSVWTDEATQLSGLSLNFADQLRWLTGGLPHVFAVPPDRTPPMSYWLGSAWLQVFGNSEMAARYLSISFSVTSVIALWAVARQFFSRRIATVSAALLAFSPNFIVMAVEIRAYAAFLLFSTFLVYSYLKLLAARPAPASLDLWAFSLSAALCSATHFFGIVISGGAFLCLLIGYFPAASPSDGLALARKAKWPLLFYLATFAGLVAFVISAVKNSGGGDISTSAAGVPLSAHLHDLVKLIYRFFGHESMLGITGLSAAALIAGVSLVVFAAIPGSNPRARQLGLFLLVNLLLVSFIDLTTHAFKAFSATYNVWALPVTALLAAAALTHGNRNIRIASGVCILVIAAADGYAALRLATAGEIYGHTRTSIVRSAVESAGASNVVILYGNDAPSIYFALMYDFSGQLRQFIDRGSTVELVGPPATRYSSKICDLSAGTLLVADDSELSAEALKFLATHPDVHTEAYQALNKFLDIHRAEIAGKWTLVSQNEYIAQSALALAVFKSRPGAESPSSGGCYRP